MGKKEVGGVGRETEKLWIYWYPHSIKNTCMQSNYYNLYIIYNQLADNCSPPRWLIYSRLLTTWLNTYHTVFYTIHAHCVHILTVYVDTDSPATNLALKTKCVQRGI